MFRQIFISTILMVFGVSTMYAQDNRAFVEHNYMIVAEVENAPLAGDWKKETAVTGYTGSCYYTWRGGNPTSITSAGQGVLAYKVKIIHAGTWYFRFHNYHDYPADQTQQNDTWVKMDNGSWVKCYQTSGRAGYWNFYCTFEIGHDHVVPKYELTAGYHTIYFSGRSHGHSIDRFHLSKDRAIIGTQYPESPREGDPIDTTDVTAILSPTAGATLNEGQTYQLTGKGKNLSWSYDANSDGLGEIAIADGDTVNFKIPTGITGPREITIMLAGDNGTDQVLCNIGTSGIMPGRTVGPDYGLEITTGLDGGIHLTLDQPGELVLSAVSLCGRQADRLLQGDVAAGTYSFTPDLPAGMYCLVINNGKEINIVHKLAIIK